MLVCIGLNAAEPMPLIVCLVSSRNTVVIVHRMAARFVYHKVMGSQAITVHGVIAAAYCHNKCSSLLIPSPLIHCDSVIIGLIKFSYCLFKGETSSAAFRALIMRSQNLLTSILCRSRTAVTPACTVSNQYTVSIITPHSQKHCHALMQYQTCLCRQQQLQQGSEQCESTSGDIVQ